MKYLSPEEVKRTYREMIPKMEEHLEKEKDFLKRNLQNIIELPIHHG